MGYSGDLRLVEAHRRAAYQGEFDATIVVGVSAVVRPAGVNRAIINLIVAAGIIGERRIDVRCCYRTIGSCQAAGRIGVRPDANSELEVLLLGIPRDVEHAHVS